MVTKTEQLQAAFNVLGNKSLIAEMIEAHAGESIIDNQLEGFLANLKAVVDERNEAKKKTEVMEQIKALMDSVNLNAEDRKSLTTIDKKPRKAVTAQWIRFEHEGKEYFIHRSPSGRAKGELAKYLESENKTLADLVVKDESKVVQSKVVTADDLGTLSKKATKTQ